MVIGQEHDRQPELGSIRMRDDFKKGVKDVLAHRAGYRCSKPNCRASTAGPSWEGISAKSNIGVAAHITAASPGGPRYDPALSAEERGSVVNGIWLCQTHAKMVDDDAERYPSATLRTWKEHAEHDAKAMLGRPVSGQSLDAAVEVSLQRGDDDLLVATGTTNLPSGTRLWVQISPVPSDGAPTTAKAQVFDRHFVSEGAKHRSGGVFKQDWYIVTVLAYFNSPWKQPDSVLAITGHDGAHLVGPHAVPIDPGVEDSHTRLEATFECLAPPLRNAPALEASDWKNALAHLKTSKLMLKWGRATSSVGETVALFMRTGGMSEKDGWRTREFLPGVVEARFSFWNGPGNEADAIWHIIPTCGSIRFRNRNAKHMSGTPT